MGKRSSYLPDVGEKFVVKNFTVLPPFIRMETVLFAIVILGACALGLAALHGVISDEFTYLRIVWGELDTFTYMVIGGALGYRAHGKNEYESEFSDG